MHGQSRRADIPLFNQLGSLGRSVDIEKDIEKQERAKSYVSRLKDAESALSDNVEKFREIARTIEENVEYQHRLDSPEESQLFTADYNLIMKALGIMFRRVPSESGSES